MKIVILDIIITIVNKNITINNIIINILNTIIVGLGAAIITNIAVIGIFIINMNFIIFEN
jgi:hypothetical protein